MLFRVDFDKPILETNPDMGIIPEFKDVPDRNLKYMCLVYDYESPYKNLPMKERKEKVAFRVGFKMEKGRKVLDKNARDIMNGNNPRLEKAIKAFKELIYDSDRETYESIDQLISNIRDFIKIPSKSAQEMDKKANMAQKLPSLSQTKKQLAQILEIQDKVVDEEEEVVEEISTLEMVNEGQI